MIRRSRRRRGRRGRKRRRWRRRRDKSRQEGEGENEEKTIYISRIIQTSRKRYSSVKEVEINQITKEISKTILMWPPCR